MTQQKKKQKRKKKEPRNRNSAFTQYNFISPHDDDSGWRQQKQQQPPCTSINKSDDNDHPVTNGYDRWSMSLRLSLTHPQPSVSIRGEESGK